MASALIPKFFILGNGVRGLWHTNHDTRIQLRFRSGHRCIQRDLLFVCW